MEVGKRCGFVVNDPGFLYISTGQPASSELPAAADDALVAAVQQLACYLLERQAYLLVICLLIVSLFSLYFN